MRQNSLVSKAIVVTLCAVGIGCTRLFAQDSTHVPRWYERIAVNGFLSTSYSYNVNRPDIRKNQLRVFDAEDNSIKVDVVELSIRKDATGSGDAGFRFDLTAGSSIPKVARSGGLNIGDLDFHQMFVSYVVPMGRGLRLDFGKFITPLGYEVIEGYDGFNDNASRSFLFGFAIPFTHTGVKATYAFSDRVSSSVMIVNGWDNSIDNNSSKTIGGQLAISPEPGFTLLVNAAYGSERDTNNSDNRLILDFVGTSVVSPMLTLGVNADYGSEQHVTALGENATWAGVAVYLRLNLLDQFSLCVRGEQFEDKRGVRTGVTQTLREFTVTPEYRPAEHFVLRGDFRFDHSDKNAFMKRGRLVDIQSTASVNALYFY